MKFRFCFFFPSHPKTKHNRGPLGQSASKGRETRQTYDLKRRRGFLLRNNDRRNSLRVHAAINRRRAYAQLNAQNKRRHSAAQSSLGKIPVFFIFFYYSTHNQTNFSGSKKKNDCKNKFNTKKY